MNFVFQIYQRVSRKFNFETNLVQYGLVTLHIQANIKLQQKTSLNRTIINKV